MPPVDLLEHFATPADATVLEGFVKVKLVHGRGTTVLLPDLLIVEGEDFRWARPLFFSACLLSHLDGAASARLGFEPTPGCQLRVGITRDRFVRSYDDGSLLYRCRITGPGRVEPGTWPTCTIDQEHVIWLDLYHHTHEAAQAAIRSSQHFRGSRWNVQGTKQLAKVEYVYFTDLRAIRSDEDLKCIAMASNGRLFLRPTNATRRDEEIAIEVYRASTLDRRHTLRIQVPAHLVASQHVWRHDAHDQPVYFEAAHQKIFRVGIESGTLLHF